MGIIDSILGLFEDHTSRVVSREDVVCQRQTDTYLINSVCRMAYVHSHMRLVFSQAERAWPVHNPFFRLGNSGKIARPDSIQATVVHNETRVPSRVRTVDLNKPDWNDLAYHIECDFAPDQTYDVYACARYENVAPLAKPFLIEKAHGLSYTVEPFSIDVSTRNLTEELAVVVILLDIHLWDLPVYREEHGTDGSTLKEERLTRCSVADNYFHKRIEAPETLHRYSVHWQAPLHDNQVDTLLRSGTTADDLLSDILGLVSKDGLVYCPHSVIEFKKQLDGLFSSAKTSLTVIDPQIEMASIEVLRNAPSGIDMTVVTGPSAHGSLNRKAFRRRLADAGFSKAILKGTWPGQNCFFIIDNTRLFWMDASLRTMLRRSGQLIEFPKGDPFTDLLIAHARKFSGQ